MARETRLSGWCVGLFGGTLIGAGLAGEACASPEFQLIASGTYEFAPAYTAAEVKAGVGATGFTDVADARLVDGDDLSISALSASAEVTASTVVTPTLFEVSSVWTGDGDVGLAEGDIWVYFTVDAPGTIALTWDLAGADQDRGASPFLSFSLPDVPTPSGTPIAFFQFDGDASPVSGASRFEVAPDTTYWLWFDLGLPLLDTPNQPIFIRAELLPGCAAADIAAPFDTLDLADIDALVAGFAAGDALADIAEPFGVLDLADIDTFITGFLAGCP